MSEPADREGETRIIHGLNHLSQNDTFSCKLTWVAFFKKKWINVFVYKLSNKWLSFSLLGFAYSQEVELNSEYLICCFQSMFCSVWVKNDDSIHLGGSSLKFTAIKEDWTRFDKHLSKHLIERLILKLEMGKFAYDNP